MEYWLLRWGSWDAWDIGHNCRIPSNSKPAGAAGSMQPPLFTMPFLDSRLSVLSETSPHSRSQIFVHGCEPESRTWKGHSKPLQDGHPSHTLAASIWITAATSWKPPQCPLVPEYCSLQSTRVSLLKVIFWFNLPLTRWRKLTFTTIKHPFRCF